MWHIGWSGGWGFMGLGMLFWLVILGLLIWLIVRVAGSSRAHSDSTAWRESAVDILKKRYARGEISKAQFEEMKKDLGT
jgi:putative membrane protein